LEIGLMVEPQAGGTYQQLLELAQWADGAGLTSFARSDHYLNGDSSDPSTDALTSFGGLARETENVQLTVLVTPLTFRHPAVIAKTAATLDEMSGGRFELGIGTGWMESEHERFGMELPDLRTRFSLLYETLAYVTTAFGRAERDTYEGRHFHLDVPDVLPRPIDLPILVGGGGPRKTPRLAGRFADEYNMFMTDPETLAGRLEHMRAAAAEVGRDPDAIKISMISQILGGADEAAYRDNLAADAARRDMETAELETRLQSRGMLCGTHEQIAGRIGEIAAMGVGRLYIQYYADLGDIDRDRMAADIGAVQAAT
jgi:alkanesulfonate monooxygenase SsuD/methylene tetrahydromethanopterin reductase-like flavin-dependent oxidoreductase (luciferase family)